MGAERDQGQDAPLSLELTRDGSDPFLFSKTLTDTHVVDLIQHLQPHDFHAWVDSERDPEDFKHLLSLARSLGESGVLEKDHALSNYAQRTFWQDLTRQFPRIIGYVLDLETQADRNMVYKSLSGLEVCC